MLIRSIDGHHYAVYEDSDASCRGSIVGILDLHDGSHFRSRIESEGRIHLHRGRSITPLSQAIDINRLAGICQGEREGAPARLIMYQEFR